MLPALIEEICTDLQKQAIHMYFYQGLNMREIGEELIIGTSSVSKLIHRGLNKIYRVAKWVDPWFYDSINQQRLKTKHRRKKVSKA